MSDDNTQTEPNGNSVQVEPLAPPNGPLSEVRAVRAATIDAVKVKMTVEIGRIDLTIREVREARQGAVFTLDRDVGEPVDVRVNGRLIARGQVVATEGRRYGIRITDMIVPEEVEQQG